MNETEMIRAMIAWKIEIKIKNLNYEADRCLDPARRKTIARELFRLREQLAKLR